MTSAGCQCDGCRTAAASTPLPVDNRPGLPRLSTRIGTFSSFRRTMLQRLVAQPELAALTTRDPDDHAVAVLEQWAAVCDVLTFYGERYANESYLRTATLDESAHRLVRLIGYRPRPGIAATTTLVLTLTEGAATTLPAGFAVRSVPADRDQQPQTFETVEDCAADARLNALPARPSLVTVDPLRSARGALVDTAAATALRQRLHPGTPVLLVSEGSPGAVTPSTVAALDVEAEQVRVSFSAPPAGSDPASAYLPRRVLRVFGVDAPETSPPTMSVDASKPGGVVWSAGSATDFSLSGSALPLDRQYDDIAVGALLLLEVAEVDTRVVEVTAVADVSRAMTDGGSVAVGPARTVTELTIAGWLPTLSDRRALRVVELAEGPLPFGDLDYADQFGNEIWVPGVVASGDGVRDGVRVAVPLDATAPGPLVSPADLAPGRRVVVADDAGHVVSTHVQGAARREPNDVTDGDSCHLVVPIAATTDDLADLRPAAATLYGNAAAATHGVTVAAEVLGDADATVAFQRFALAKSPLTRVPAATADASAPELTVRVDGVAWPVVDEIVGAGPRDQVVALDTEPDGRTVVRFGDGEHGARPSSGTANVVARYRYGSGVAGRVPAGSLTQATNRPPGFDRVTNPAAASGGADPEDARRVRERGPGVARVIGRAVNAADCADVLVASGAVAKAAASTVWDGRGPIVVVTVAGDDGGTYDADGLATLAAAVRAAGQPYRRVVAVNYVAVPLMVTATVTPAAGYAGPTVLAGVRAAVLGRLSFDVIGLGAAVHLSDLYLAAYQVPGVDAVNVTRFGFRPPRWLRLFAPWSAFLTEHGVTRDPAPERLRMLPGRAPRGQAAPAELPTLADTDLTLTLVAAAAAPATGGLT